MFSSIAQSVERMTVNHDVTGSSPVRGAKKKASRKTCFFLSNPKDWYVISRERVCNLRPAQYGITRQRVFLLRIDYIQHFVLFPYCRQAADFIHAYRRDYIESYVEVLDVGALFAFLGVKNTPFFSPLHLLLNFFVSNL